MNTPFCLLQPLSQRELLSFSGLRELKIKESNRLATMAEALRNAGEVKTALR